MPNCSKCKLLIHKAHGNDLMRHFRVVKILHVLHEHFYWSNMKIYVQIICDRSMTFIQAKSKV